MTKTPKTPLLQLIETEDGSNSLYVPSINETYHSFHGAIRESRHVFIDQGLAYWQSLANKTSLNILEIGFGTGLNAILALQYALEHHIYVTYDTLEPFPLPQEIVDKLNYPLLLKDTSSSQQFETIHAASWNQSVSIDTFFFLHKLKLRLEDFIPPQTYDVVFFDAFAPNKQAELWEISMLKKIYDCLNNSGVMVTYCAKGQLKRDLKTLGFEVQTLPGPPGKKEMVRAIKRLDQ